MYVVTTTHKDKFFSVSCFYDSKENAVAEATKVVCRDKNLTWVERLRVEKLLEQFDYYSWDGHKTVTIQKV